MNQQPSDNMKILNLSLMVEPTDNGFTQAMKKVATGGYIQMSCGITDFNKKCVEAAELLRPDIIFIQIQQDGVMTLETAKRLTEIGFTIQFSGDVRSEVPNDMKMLGSILNLTTFTNMTDVEKCISYGINSDYLEIGYDPERYKKWGIHLKTPEIVAHFNNYGSDKFPLSDYRIQVVNRLNQEFGNRFGVAGIGWVNSYGDFNHSQIQESVAYSNAKIGINISHFSYKRYSSDRMLRLMGSGLFCLSHHYPNIEDDFEIGKHLDVFDDGSIDELISKCHYYLLNDKERNNIALNGYNHVRENFTFDNMAENIILL